MPPARKKTAMSDAHKQALAEGRAQSRAVRDYLDALEANRPKRGRRRTAETVERQLTETREALAAAGGSAKLELIQRRRDLEVELATLQAGGGGIDLSALEQSFVEHGKAYAQRKAISYAAFREFGVPADVLKKAGISRAG
ncbi:MAG TPA: hypothetical protein VFZ83_08935 [Acidimicrobiia bacterium]|nr:hypothetical protein [Acidimicrobiia bacterium]